MKIIVTGSEGLLGKEIKTYLKKNHEVMSLDLVLGHDLTDEQFVKTWFSENKADSLVNCFAMNDHVEEGKTRGTIFDLTLDSFQKFLNINLTTLSY